MRDSLGNVRSPLPPPWSVEDTTAKPPPVDWEASGFALSPPSCAASYRRSVGRQTGVQEVRPN
jgi:hypothetical protein